jgi:hypothetical protein
MYANIQDCDEGPSTTRLIQTISDFFLTLSVDSLQFLGASPLPAAWSRLPNMGDVASLRHSKLGVHTSAFTVRSRRHVTNGDE